LKKRSSGVAAACDVVGDGLAFRDAGEFEEWVCAAQTKDAASAVRSR
jgi:hypothetical protein